MTTVIPFVAEYTAEEWGEVKQSFINNPAITLEAVAEVIFTLNPEYEQCLGLSNGSDDH